MINYCFNISGVWLHVQWGGLNFWDLGFCSLTHSCLFCKFVGVFMVLISRICLWISVCGKFKMFQFHCNFEFFFFSQIYLSELCFHCKVCSVYCLHWDRTSLGLTSFSTTTHILLVWFFFFLGVFIFRRLDINCMHFPLKLVSALYRLKLPNSKDNLLFFSFKFFYTIIHLKVGIDFHFFSNIYGFGNQTWKYDEKWSKQ